MAEQDRTVLGYTGYKFMRTNPEAKQFKAGSALDLPGTVDLRRLMTPVEDQLQTNSCTANAVAGAYEYLIKRQLNNGTHFDVSRLFIYYNARMRDNCAHVDEGSSIQSAMEGAQRFGACAERTWPFDEGRVCARPPAAAYQEGVKFSVGDMEQLQLNLRSWKQCLAEGYPVIFACALFESFDDCSETGGVVRMPGANELKRGEHGLHAMLCVGYSDVDEVFIVRNSWGRDWGDQGYCYIPYNYMMHKTLNGGDNWVMRATQAIPAPEACWRNDEQPVVNGGMGVDFLINEVAPALLESLLGKFFSEEYTWEFEPEWPDMFAETLEATESNDWDAIDSMPEYPEAPEASAEEEADEENEEEEDEGEAEEEEDEAESEEYEESDDESGDSGGDADEE